MKKVEYKINDEIDFYSWLKRVLQFTLDYSKISKEISGKNNNQEIVENANNCINILEKAIKKVDYLEDCEVNGIFNAFMENVGKDVLSISVAMGTYINGINKECEA